MCQEIKVSTLGAAGSNAVLGLSYKEPSAKEKLRDHVISLRKRANSLEALANALPEKLPEDAEEGLFELLYPD